MSIDRQFELDEGVGLIDLQLCLGDRVIDTIMDIKGRRIGIVHTIATHIALIGQDEGRRYRADGGGICCL